MSKIYAIDFDGTLCENRYPDIGDPITDIIDYVKNLVEEGNKIILWTCRTGKMLDEAIEWCKEKEIIFDKINENLESVIEEYGDDTRKISAYRYIDDKAVSVESILGKEVEQNMKQSKIWRLKQQVNDPTTLDIYIYGEIEGDSYDFWSDMKIESDTSANHFKEELAKYSDIKNINLYVNSFGGSVFEAMSIRNQLKRHSATVTGVVDGFAASAASFILTGCDIVKMYSNTTQMLHNMWNVAVGNSKQLRKAADDMDVMMEGNRQAYLEKANGKLTEEKLIEILDNETWLTAEQCLEYGLCDEVIAEEADLTKAKQLLQKLNKTFEQQISYSKNLALQLKELTVVKPKEIIEEQPQKEKEPVQKTNAEKLMAAFKIKNLEGK